MGASMGQDMLARLTMMAVHSSHAQQVATQAIVKNHIHRHKSEEAVLPV